MTKKNNLMTEQNILIDNSSGNISKLIIEPWAEEITIKQGDKVYIVGFGPIENAQLQLEFENNLLIICGWQGSKLTIYLNEKILETASKAIEAL
jgi:hypothetical protein